MQHNWTASERKALNLTQRGYVAEVVASLPCGAAATDAEIEFAVRKVGRTFGATSEAIRVAIAHTRRQVPNRP